MTKHIIISFGGRRRIIALPSSYNSLLKVARKQFPSMGSIYSLVALYQPEDFKGTIEEKCWVELDETAYYTLHDRAVVYFNVQHHITKEYLLPLPNTDPDKPQPQVNLFEETLLAGSADTDHSLGPDDSNIIKIKPVPEDDRDNGDACASGWGGASERFGRSAKYIPNLQDCKDATKVASDQWSDPESTKLEEVEKGFKQVNSDAHQGWWGRAHDTPHTQHQHLEACAMGCDHSRHRELCLANEAGEFPSSAQKTFLHGEADINNTGAIQSQNDDWGRIAGWGHGNEEHYLKNENTKNDNHVQTFQETSAHDGWAPAQSMYFEEEDLGEPFNQSTPVQGRVPVSDGGVWKGPAVVCGAPPARNDTAWGQSIPGASSQHCQDRALSWCLLPAFGFKSENSDDRCYGTQNLNRETAQFKVPRPTEASASGPAPGVGWCNEQSYTSDWSPEPQNQKQSGPCGQQQTKENQPQPHGIEYSTGSPTKHGRHFQPSTHYWSRINPQLAKGNTVEKPVSPLGDEAKQPEAAHDSYATITGYKHGGYDNWNCYNGPRTYVSSSSDDGPENSIDGFWGKPSKGSRGFLKGWGAAAMADKATQYLPVGGSSSNDPHEHKTGVGKRQHRKF